MGANAEFVGKEDFWEPRALSRFRKLAASQPEVFRQGRTVVVADPHMARNVLAFKPDLFGETALLGHPSPQLKRERSVLREYTNSLAGQDLEIASRITTALSKTSDVLTAMVEASLDLFCPLMIGGHYYGMRETAITYCLSRINHHYLRNSRNRRDLDRHELQSAISKIDLEGLDDHLFGRHIAMELAEQGRERVVRLVADAMTAFAIPAVVAGTWMLFERRLGGLLSNDALLVDSNPQSVAMELLRLRPPAWNHARSVRGPTELAGVRVDIGDQVLVPVGFIHTTPRHWSDPLVFVPARWDELDFTTPAYMPFSIGRRSCVAAQLAMLFLRAVAEVAPLVHSVKSAPLSRFRIGPLYGPPNFKLELARHGTIGHAEFSLA